MSRQELLTEVGRLLSLLKGSGLARLSVIPWAAPVVAFGSSIDSQVATLGLNPSNLEFVDGKGLQLTETKKRFESLQSLHLSKWEQVNLEHVELILESCEEYFFRNPYDQWFKRLEKILVETGASYYGRIGRGACHLDLVPFATAEKWSALSRIQKTELIELGAPSLARTLSASNVKVLVLNGATVVREFGRLLSGASMQAQPQPSWTLQGGRVQGLSYTARVSAVGGIRLQHEILVLGFNHNIQSSFGVTTQVVGNIAAWIGQQAEGVLE